MFSPLPLSLESRGARQFGSQLWQVVRASKEGGATGGTFYPILESENRARKVHSRYEIFVSTLRFPSCGRYTTTLQTNFILVVRDGKVKIYRKGGIGSARIRGLTGCGGGGGGGAVAWRMAASKDITVSNRQTRRHSTQKGREGSTGRFSPGQVDSKESQYKPCLDACIVSKKCTLIWGHY